MAPAGSAPERAVRSATRARARLALALLIAVAAGLPAMATAHPHAWIDLRVTLDFDSDGRLASMHQLWVIDPTYSHMLLEEMTRDMDGDAGIDSVLETVGPRMLDNLAEYDHFTELEAGGETLDTPPAESPELRLEDRRLHLGFEIPLDRHDIGAEEDFTYRVYDPTYWIEIRHDPGDVIQVNRGDGCRVELEEPRPDPQLVRYAATLERESRSPIEDLGRHFAEIARLECE
ncbi:DUF1007 family protein [Thioalkalivibrio sp. ALE11]|uniref:DUF1007 family protein n=1 Tax=Thioalkalivibrio sp. ALE11 TaxID=1265494 RepID=UPI00037A14B3|nr:DUF1007 family protein [Thioalkalivibrio sp. ALE11]